MSVCTHAVKLILLCARIRLHGLFCYVTWELNDWAVVGFVDAGAEWKACVMLQESVFSISPVTHNIEDNDDEETNEDHTADGLFPRGTENSFYLQYSHVLFFTLCCFGEQQMHLNVQPQIRKSWDSMENANKKRK